MLLTQIQHAARLKVSTRTFRRRVVMFGVQPEDTNGNEPLFSVEAINAMEAKRKGKALRDRYGVPTGILTVKQAKRRAAR
jgi:hypothetical protein